MPKTKNVTTPAEAAQILLSACRYCQEAGLKVFALNDGAGKIGIIVEGLALVQDVSGDTFVPSDSAG